MILWVHKLEPKISVSSGVRVRVCVNSYVCNVYQSASIHGIYVVWQFPLYNCDTQKGSGNIVYNKLLQNINFACLWFSHGAVLFEFEASQTCSKTICSKCAIYYIVRTIVFLR